MIAEMGQMSNLESFGQSGLLSGLKTIVFVDNHDTQRSQELSPRVCVCVCSMFGWCSLSHKRSYENETGDLMTRIYRAHAKIYISFVDYGRVQRWFCWSIGNQSTSSKLSICLVQIFQDVNAARLTYKSGRLLFGLHCSHAVFNDVTFLLGLPALAFPKFLQKWRSPSWSQGTC